MYGRKLRIKATLIRNLWRDTRLNGFYGIEIIKITIDFDGKLIITITHEPRGVGCYKRYH